MHVAITVGFFGVSYIRFHPVMRSWCPYYRYLYIAENTPFRRVPRSAVPELDNILRSMEPALVKIKGINLYEDFKGIPMQRLHQISANSTDITDDEFYFLHRYEMEGSHKKSIKRRSGFIKKPPKKMRIRGEKKEWIQSNGYFVMKDLMWGRKLFTKFWESHQILVTGYFYYPPGGFREWHTNENDVVGWRLYYVKREEPNRSWFLWKDPVTGKTHRENDCNDCYNMFKVKSRQDGVLWHSVYSDTHRFSIGINIPESFASKITQRLEEGGYE